MNSEPRHASSKSFSFPVKDFKRIETPHDTSGYRNYLCIVDVLDLPDMSEWGRSNLRDPRITGKIPNLIRQGLVEEDLFVYRNRGIVLVAADAKYDNKAKSVCVTLRNRDVHGLLDGGHTHLIIKSEQEALRERQEEEGVPLHKYVRIEILVGFDLAEIKDIAQARNTSKQVQDESLLNLSGRFDPLKDVLESQPYKNMVAFKEYELDADDVSKPIDVRDIISIMYMFKITEFDESKHPINGYRSKKACLEDFKQKTSEESYGDYALTLPLVSDILHLHDEIYLALPNLYNESRKKFGDESVQRGRFGGLTGVTTLKKKPLELYFIRKTSEYRIPAGFIYPILGSFRALVTTNGNSFKWVSGCNPFKLLKGDLGIKMANIIGEYARRDQNPSKTGKSESLWQSLYQAAQIKRLEIEMSNLRKNMPT